MNLKYNTQVGYLNIIERHLKPTFGIYRLNALSSASIQEYANTLKMLVGDLPKRALKMVQEWTHANQAALLDIWKTQNFVELPPLE